LTFIHIGARSKDELRCRRLPSSYGAIGNLTYGRHTGNHTNDYVMTWRENEVVRSQFSTCLRRANDLVDITSRQDSKNPSYKDLLDIMSLRSGLQEKSIRVDDELLCYLNYDEGSSSTSNKMSTLGKTSRETVYTALLVSTEFLRSLTNINDVFQDSRVVCLRLAAEIASFVNRSDGARPDETEDMVGIRSCLKEKFARLKSNWENLVQLTTDYDETVEFAELVGLIQVTETATNNALLGSEDLLTKLRDRDLWDGIAYKGADGMSESEDDGGDSTLRDGADDVGGADMTEDYFLWTTFWDNRYQG
jgi:hypothetical protein